MKNFLNRLLRRGDNSDRAEGKFQVTHGILSGDSMRPQSEQEMIEQLGINYHMLEDDELSRILMNLAITKNDGQEAEIDLNALAMRIDASKVIRASYVEPIDAEIAQLEAERSVNRIELSLNEDTYEYGGTNLLEAYSRFVKTAWSDATKGRKAKLLKVISKSFEVNIPEAGKKKSES